MWRSVAAEGEAVNVERSTGEEDEEVSMVSEYGLRAPARRGDARGDGAGDGGGSGGGEVFHFHQPSHVTARLEQTITTIIIVIDDDQVNKHDNKTTGSAQSQTRIAIAAEKKKKKQKNRSCAIVPRPLRGLADLT